MINRLPRYKNLSSFTCLNIAQFLVCLNDSIFRLLVVYSLIDTLGIEKSNVILAFTGFLFILPYLLFSMPAGELADRFSKRNLIVWLMGFEIVAIGLGALAIHRQEMISSYFALFLVALQSALYSPAKSAIIPELVPQAKISKANGYISLTSYGALVIGIFFASFVSEITHRNYTLVALISLGFSLIAFLASLGIEKTPVQNPQKTINPLFFLEIYRSLKKAHLYPLLLVALIASAFFFFTAGFTQLNVLPFGVQSLSLTDLQTGYIFMAVAVGIGLGSLLVILLSGRNIELGLSIWGAFGTAFSYILLYFFQHSLIISTLLIGSLGIHGGLFIVPINAYIQIIAPHKDRGSIIAAGNFASFVFILLAPISIYLLGEKLHFTGAESFFCVGLFCLFVALWFALMTPNHITRLIGILASRILVKLHFKGHYEEATFKKASLLVCPYPSLRILLSLIQTFPKVTFIRITKRGSNRFFMSLYTLFHIYPISLDQPLDNEISYLKNQLLEGSFLCFFIQERKNQPPSTLRRSTIDQMVLKLQESALPIEIRLHKRAGFAYFRKKLPPPFNFSMLVESFQKPFENGDHVL